jgi:hypothetical protein
MFLTIARGAAVLPVASIGGAAQTATTQTLRPSGTLLPSGRFDSQTRNRVERLEQRGALRIVALRQRILSFAEARMGQTIGRGECTDLVDAALADARAVPQRNYVWGSPVQLQNAAPGDIIQFFNTSFTSPDGRSQWGTSTQHTAIIAAVNGSRVTLIEQNVNNNRSVLSNSYDLSWSHTGTFIIYQAARA